MSCPLEVVTQTYRDGLYYNVWAEAQTQMSTLCPRPIQDRWRLSKVVPFNGALLCWLSHLVLSLPWTLPLPQSNLDNMGGVNTMLSVSCNNICIKINCSDYWSVLCHVWLWLTQVAVVMCVFSSTSVFLSWNASQNCLQGVAVQYLCYSRCHHLTCTQDKDKQNKHLGWGSHICAQTTASALMTPWREP